MPTRNRRNVTNLIRRLPEVGTPIIAQAFRIDQLEERILALEQRREELCQELREGISRKWSIEERVIAGLLDNTF